MTEADAGRGAYEPNERPDDEPTGEAEVVTQPEVCPVCKIERRKASDYPPYVTPIYSPGVRHDANNRDCPSVPRLSPERAAALCQRLDDLDRARGQALHDSRNYYIR